MTGVTENSRTLHSPSDCLTSPRWSTIKDPESNFGHDYAASDFVYGQQQADNDPNSSGESRSLSKFNVNDMVQFLRRRRQTKCQLGGTSTELYVTTQRLSLSNSQLLLMKQNLMMSVSEDSISA